MIAIRTTTNKTSRVDRPTGVELGENEIDKELQIFACWFAFPLKGIAAGIARPLMLT